MLPTPVILNAVKNLNILAEILPVGQNDKGDGNQFMSYLKMIKVRVERTLEGCLTKIRTWANRTKTCCATITP